MKKALILISMVVTSTVTLAQTGSWYAGGVVGFASHTDKDANDNKDVTKSWAFGPEVGTFLRDDIQVGIALGITGSSEEDDGNDVSSSVDFSPTLYGRKFIKVTDALSAFAGLYLGYMGGSETDKSSGTDVKTKHSGFNARVGIGIAYSLSPKLGIVGQYGLLGFQTVSYETEGHDAGNSSDFDFGVNTVGASTLSQGNGSGSVFNIGIYYTFMTK